MGAPNSKLAATTPAAENDSNKYRIQDEVDSEVRVRLCSDVWAQVVDKNEYVDLTPFDIENLVFEGGGCKGVAYCGAVKALEDLGLLKKIKRFAGTSAGSYIAMRLALGAPVDDVLLNSMENIQEAIYDSGKLGFLMNIMSKFGWHTGKNLLEYIRRDVEASTGSPDTTFYQLYKKTGRELCIVITNVSTAAVEYCHPKTTPHMSIAQAVRTSMSIPIIFQPYIVHSAGEDVPQYFCDGGLVDNYPLCAFDGWYLSMEKEDSFFHKIGETRGPFHGKFNDKTLGLLLFNAMESEHFEEVYIQRYGDKLTGKRPDTKLVRKRGQLLEKLMLKKQSRVDLMESSRKLLDHLAMNDMDRSGDISLAEFKLAMTNMKNDREMHRHLKNIFGTTNLDLDELFREADIDENNQLSFTECLHMLQNQGVPLRQLIKTSVPGDIDSMADYLLSIISALDYRVRSLTSRPEDTARSVGIYTDYIATTDFDMAVEDKIYGVKQGWVATIAYLRERCLRNQVNDKAALGQSKSLPDWVKGEGPHIDLVDSCDPRRKTVPGRKAMGHMAEGHVQADSMLF